MNKTYRKEPSRKNSLAHTRNSNQADTIMLGKVENKKVQGWQTVFGMSTMPLFVHGAESERKFRIFHSQLCARRLLPIFACRACVCACVCFHFVFVPIRMQIDGVIHGRKAMQIQMGGGGRSPNRKARITKQCIGKDSCASANSMRAL